MVPSREPRAESLGARLPEEEDGRGSLNLAKENGSRFRRALLGRARHPLSRPSPELRRLGQLSAKTRARTFDPDVRSASFWFQVATKRPSRPARTGQN